MRNSGIEILRILAAVSVVILHYHEIACARLGGGGINIITLDFLESFAISAVDIFVAISGYFMINNQKRTLGKMVSLLFQVSLFNTFFYFSSIALGNSYFTFNIFVQNLVPHNYFVVLYVVMYCFSPYINTFLLNLTKKGGRRFLCISLVLFSLYPTLVNLSGELLGIKWFGLNSIGAWGSQKGFTIVNFLLLYSIGACLRLDFYTIPRKKWLIFLSGLLIFLWALLCKYVLAVTSNSAWEYHNPLVVLLAVLLLNYFRGLEIQNVIINNMAKAAFVCYLIHYNILSHLNVAYYVSHNVIFMVGHIVISIIIIYFISWIVYFIYSYLFIRIINKLDQVELRYF